MAIGMGGKVYNTVSVLTEPNTYDADITPENMRHGMTAYAKGKKVTGTGKAFAFVNYGEGQLQKLQDEDGNERYGFTIFSKIEPNLIFITPTETGDIVLQTNHVVDMKTYKPIAIGVNHTASGNVIAIYKENRIKIYLENTQDNLTRLKFFCGKDNDL